MMMSQALVSVAAAAFVVLSGVGQADKGELRSIQSEVMRSGCPPSHRGRGDPLDRWPQGRGSVWWWHRGTCGAWEET